MGGNLGAEAGKIAGMEAALAIAKEETSKENPLDMDESKMKALKVRGRNERRTVNFSVCAFCNILKFFENDSN